MGKFSAIILTVLFGARLAFAHEMEDGSKEGVFGLKPEYIHILLNPLPVYGLAIGIVILASGLLARNHTVRIAGLIVTAICAASAWPVLAFGQRGYNNLYPMLDTESQQWLDEHMRRAESFIYFFYTTALLALAGLAFLKKSPKAANWLAILTLASGIASLGIGGWISRAGGEVSHSEFRTGEAPTNSPPHEHQHSHNEPKENK